MAKFNVKIKGLDQLKKKLDSKGQKNILQDISEDLKRFANEINDKARLNVTHTSSNNGFLRNSITTDGKDLKWIIYAGMGYAPYVEFGTKTKVNVPPEMQEVANQFKGKKIGVTKFKESISNWMKNRGIPQEALYPIMAKILNVGISPQPFLYPSFKEVTANGKIEKDIDITIQSYFNK